MISFVVPVFNASGWVASIISTISRLPGDHELIIVDNDSDQATKDVIALTQRTFDFELHTSPRNLGFGPANNLGADLASGDIIVFTQPDVAISITTPQLITEASNSNPSQLLGARLIDWDSGWNTFAGTGIIPYLEGWFLFCTREAWITNPHFDPMFFPADYEDIDLSYSWGKHNIRQVDVHVQHPNPGQSWQSRAGTQERYRHTQDMRKLFMEKWSLTDARTKS